MTVSHTSYLRGTAIGAALFASILSSAAQTLYTLETGKRFQRIDHFGASDCWSAQRLGLFPDAKREQMADWLFSTALSTNGQPLGIGLSLWRFNVGAGSAEQGKDSHISAPLRRAECFLAADGSYDWSKQAGQRWFLQAAKKRGVGNFLAFCNSAPVHFTANGLANNKDRPKDGSCNLKPEQYEAFADFLATVLAELGAREKIPFTAVSPFNEPEWGWESAKQEGTPARVEDIARLVRLLDQKLSDRNLATQIIVPESGQIDRLFKKNSKHPRQSNQIEAFFAPDSPNTLAGLAHVPRLVAGHSYWTTSPNDALFSKRRELRKKLDEHALSYWQTELCIMSNDHEIGGGRGRDLSMKTALYVARVIHADLCVANASAWHWWLAFTFGDYKDGLIYVQANDDKADGDLADSRLMWALGNFSRFVRPGATRIGVSSPTADPDDATGLLVSAYQHEQHRAMTCVLINMSEQPRPVKLAVPGCNITQNRVYLTSDADGATLQPQPGMNPLSGYTIPARAIVTWIGRY